MNSAQEVINMAKYRLKEDLPMDNTWYHQRSSGGVAKAGTIFELLAEPTPKKKMYKLEPIGEKFPYHLNLRKNDFKRLFEEIKE